MQKNLRSGGAFLHFSILSLLLIATSCASSPKDFHIPTPELAKVKKIAILPFSSISDRTSASETVTNIFTTEIFNSGKFEVVETGNVLDFMVNEGVSVLGEIDVDSLKMMSGRLDVDAVIVGSIDEFDDGLNHNPPVPVVSLTIRIVEPNSGKIIWSGKNKRSGEDYVSVFGIGRIRPLSALTKKVVNEIIGRIR